MKSNASQLLNLGLCILKDAAAKCYTATVADWPRDFRTMKSRVKREGISFLTITLPAFGSDFEKALDQGQIGSMHFSGWKRCRCLPSFLKGFTSLVFAQDGLLKEEPDVAAIEGIRQICYAFKKILLPCTPEREARAISDYLAMERDLSVFSMPDDRIFNRTCDLLWGDVFGVYLDHQELIPKHGPGATCEGIRGNSKYVHRSWHERLQACFPVDTFAFPNTIIGSEQLGDVNILQEDEELPVKITLVPKTLKTPRIIAIEPVCMQYAQQALLSFLVQKLSSHWITAGHINFNDQTVNQRLALIASRTGELATLDLSSASDRVPLSGVERMLRVCPDLSECLFSSRSTHAKLPSGEVIPLRKFASMGSATCFPIEAMYFFSVILAKIVELSGRPLTFKTLYDVSRDVYIYGDDIIIPKDAVEGVLQALAAYNCKVGLNKSFWNGKFRESCGVEAYDGEYVTPTYIRRLGPENSRSASETISWVATSNQFYLRGYWLTAAYMKRFVERTLKRSLPLVKPTSAGLGWVNYQDGYSIQRWNKALHRFEVRTLVASPVYQADPLEGYPALMKFLLSSTKRKEYENEPIKILETHSDYGDDLSPEDLLAARKKDHLHRTARHGAVSTKVRWTTPY